MSFRSLLQSLKPRLNPKRTRRAAPRPATCRLALDSLDDRCVPAAMLTIGDITVREGNDGTHNALVTVYVTEPHGNSITVNYNTADGSAQAGSDYNAVSGRLTFKLNEMSKSILVPIRGDRLVESDEDLLVRLSNSKGAKIADSTGIVTIAEDEPPLVSINDMSVLEGNSGSTALKFTVSLSHAYDLPITVQYSTADGSAIAGTDYTAASGALTFGKGVTSLDVMVDVMGDRVPELDKTFYVNLTSPDAAITKPQGTGTIRDNEPRISVTDASVLEGNSGTTSLTFTIRLSVAYDQAVTVNYATTNGSATADSDYTAASTSWTFEPGQPTSKDITVLANGDRVAEWDETFLVNLTTPDSSAAISRGTGVGTIWDDEPQISISDATNYGDYTPFTFAVSVSNLAPGETVTVDWTTADSSAFAGVDYEGANGTLTFTADAPTQYITINMLDPYVYDQIKDFVIYLFNASPNASISDGIAIGWWYLEPAPVYDYSSEWSYWGS
jgi:Calx-beta domain